MGCDCSKKTKADFIQQTQEITLSITAMKHQQKMLEKQISELTIPNEPTETIDDLKQSLMPHLEKIESLLEEIRNSKENGSSFEKPRNSTESHGRNKFQVSTKAESSETHSRRETPSIKKEKDVQSILDDPAIKAMIEKNRQKFVSKKNK
ncbi:hypothetical protein SteCoe_14470 [Stentor coeruleus]|uniref:Uncharacterized protein n=1 Tax=Stentor coeruleus TaxID=5963 RepID=A0A1R2C5V3_9CILI|nr:hypothetical protein SteCoe_14470 [Stentor coeruleus]